MSSRNITNWNGSATLLHGPCEVRSFTIHNENASTRYLQLFNAAAVADVTLGTTAPVVNLPITTDAVVTVTCHRKDFDLGLVAVLTTATRGAATGGTGNLSVDIR